MFKLNSYKNQQGLTLLETLLVVAVIAILAGIIIIAVNPNKDLADARNSQRKVDVNTVLDGVYQYMLHNNGTIPNVITAAATEICATGASNCIGLIDLSIVTASGQYLTSLPKDPQCPTACHPNGTGYIIFKTTNNRVTVAAPDAEDTTISVIR